MLNKNVDLTGKTILVTGAAGFIGANLSCELLRMYEDIKIIGIDSMNDYYDISLKEYRLHKLLQEEKSRFIFEKGNLAHKECIDRIFQEYHPFDSQ